MPLVSVILTSYNREKLLPGAIKSILGQSLQDFELIIVDDGSTDGSMEIAERFAAEDARVRVIQQKNSGPSVARNNGVAAAQGKYVAFQDDDDESLPLRLEKQANFLNEYPDVAAVECGRTRINENGMILETKSYLRRRLFSFLPEKKTPAFIYCDYAHPPVGITVMLHRNVFLDIGGYRPFFLYVEDFDFAFRLIEKHTAVCLYERLYRYRCENPGVTQSRENRRPLLRWRYLWAAHYAIHQRHSGKPCPIDNGESLEAVVQRLGQLPWTARWRCIREAHGATRHEMRRHDGQAYFMRAVSPLLRNRRDKWIAACACCLLLIQALLWGKITAMRQIVAT